MRQSEGCGFGLACPVCGSREVVRIGYVGRGSFRVQRFQCRRCGRTFTELEGTPFKGVHDPKALVAVAYLRLRAGLSEFSIARLLGIPYPTVRRLSKRVMEYRDFMERLLRVLLKVREGKTP
ncbi:IS1/IS1595 family N-terminal zinc-binding domain-containing protein [Thermococcus henrietii]|uniref:IS1/IS1595 family N-terminal zinc-binding domain-containing protein n=1 Tax=Thermococcus henrietii TaxID=2016361 RepID=UPI0011AB5BA0|nr:IS1 family transposase [Thermococcus henrietii]